MSEAVALYVDFAARHRAPQTLPMLRSDLGALARFLALRQVSHLGQLKREHLHAWRRHLRARRLAPTTVARHISHLRGWCNYLVARGWQMTNLAAWLHPGVPRARRSAPGPIDVSAMLARCADERPISLRDRALIEILYATGMRASEVARLRIDDLELEQRQVIVRGRRSGPQALPLHQEACAALQRYLVLGRAAATPGESLFLSRRGGPLRERDVRARVRALGRSAGLGAVTPEALRWQIAREMAQRGADQRAIAQLLGHMRLSALRRRLG